MIFGEKTFADCSLVPRQRMPHPQISQRKLSQTVPKPRNSRRFSPSKVSHYTVCVRVCKHVNIKSESSASLYEVHVPHPMGSERSMKEAHLGSQCCHPPMNEAHLGSQCCRPPMNEAHLGSQCCHPPMNEAHLGNQCCHPSMNEAHLGSQCCHPC